MKTLRTQDDGAYISHDSSCSSILLHNDDDSSRDSAVNSNQLRLSTSSMAPGYPDPKKRKLRRGPPPSFCLNEAMWYQKLFKKW